MARRNPPDWAEKVLERFWRPLTREVPLAELPGSPKQSELGCGAYGCVWATSTPWLVLKLTSDETEAAFAQASREIQAPDVMAGIVRYRRVLQLGAATRSRRPVYLLWRDEVSTLGLLGLTEAERQLAHDQLISFKAHAQVVRHLVARSPERQAGQVVMDRAADPSVERLGGLAISGSGYAYDAFFHPPDQLRYWNSIGWVMKEDLERAAVHLAAARRIALLMLDGPLHAVGMALIRYSMNGILLADVHAGNVGRIGDEWVITDPGQAVFLSERWRRITVPVLAERRTRTKASTFPVQAWRETFGRVLEAMGQPYGRVTVYDTGPRSFRYDLRQAGQLTAQLDAAWTDKTLTLTIASNGYSEPIVRETLLDPRIRPPSFPKVRVRHERLRGEAGDPLADPRAATRTRP